jgi:hypothetical protein
MLNAQQVTKAMNRLRMPSRKDEEKYAEVMRKSNELEEEFVQYLHYTHGRGLPQTVQKSIYERAQWYGDGYTYEELESYYKRDADWLREAVAAVQVKAKA